MSTSGVGYTAPWKGARKGPETLAHTTLACHLLAIWLKTRHNFSKRHFPNLQMGPLTPD